MKTTTQRALFAVIASLAASAAHAQASSPPAGSVTLPPSMINKQGSVTHSASTTAYATNELFANNTTGNVTPTQVPVTATAGGSGLITHAVMEDSGTGTTAPGGWTVYLFNASPTVTSLVDYSAYVGPYATDVTGGSYLGSVTCASFTKTNDATAKWVSECTASNLITGPLPYNAVTGQTYVYALFAYTGSSNYTPISGESLTLNVSTTRDQ